MNAEQITSVVLQLPLVAIFVWFSLELLNRFQKTQERRDVEWREFLEQERSARTEMARRLAEEIKQMSVVVERLTVRYDEHERRVVEMIQRALQRDGLRDVDER